MLKKKNEKLHSVAHSEAINWASLPVHWPLPPPAVRFGNSRARDALVKWALLASTQRKVTHRERKSFFRGHAGDAECKHKDNRMGWPPALAVGKRPQRGAASRGTRQLISTAREKKNDNRHYSSVVSVSTSRNRGRV